MGNNLSHTPKHQASLWLGYSHKNGDFASLALGGGLRYTDFNYGDLSNSRKVPFYVLINASVYYGLSKLNSNPKGACLAVNMSNLLDRDYLSACGEGSCYDGDRRSVLASPRYNG